MQRIQFVLIMTMLRISALLSLSAARKLGRFMAALYWPFGGRSRKVTEINIAAAFPQLSPKQQSTLARNSILATGELFTEMGHIWLKPWSRVAELVLEVKGAELIKQAYELRQQFGGLRGVEAPQANATLSDLSIPIFDTDLGSTAGENENSFCREATQTIDPDLWPLKYHFVGDPVVPGNFGTHGMIALLKASAHDDFGLTDVVFRSMTKKSFSGMIFEDPKQIRFVLTDVEQNDLGEIVAREAGLYLENTQGQRLIETPIYTFKNLTVAQRP